MNKVLTGVVFSKYRPIVYFTFLTYYLLLREVPAIARAVDEIVRSLRNGGRLIYVGAGRAGGWPFWMRRSVHRRLEFRVKRCRR